MDLECQNCGYNWNYQGQSQHYATCPRCKSSVNIMEQDDNQKTIEVEEKTYSQAIKAVTRKHVCDFCGNDYPTEPECVLHIYNNHIKQQPNR